LADAADCVAEMSECVAGLGPAPSGALEVLQRVRDWTNRLLQEPSAAFPPVAVGPAAFPPAAFPPAAAAPAAVAPPQAAAPAPAPPPEEPAVAEAVSEGLAAEVPAAGETQQWLRVPASLIERLLTFANEASILLSQAQEQALEVDRVRATLRTGTDQLQDLAGELERLVDVRGLALDERRTRSDFDALELDEYNDLHMVSRRIAES